MSEETSNGNTADFPNSAPRSRAVNFTALKRHAMTHKVDCALWVIRFVAIMLSLGYFVPIFGSSQSAYYKALLANEAINALRLHQRLGMVRFNREFLAAFLAEDSCHYLFYSMIFLYVAPVTLVILPILLFSVLHAASYSLTLLDLLGQNSWWGARLFVSLVEFQSLNILRLIAFTEIALMPYTVLLVLTGKASLLTPFIYYHFLTQRYTSRRNPYNRNMFRELRLLIERMAAKPELPNFLKSALHGIVNFTIKLAPPHVAQQQQQPPPPPPPQAQ